MNSNFLNSSFAYYLAAAVIVLATLSGIVVGYPQLPAQVPMHWDLHGQVDGYAPKWTLYLYGPGIMTGMIALFAAMPWLSPRKFEVESFRATYLLIMILVVGLIAYLNILVLMAGLGVALDVSRAIEGCICLLIALLGNVMGKVRRNFFIGIRTPWTLASERVWHATHRVAAKTMFAAGLLGLAGVFLRGPFWLPLAFILVGVLIPAGYSLAHYKRLERQGGVEG